MENGKTPWGFACKFITLRNRRQLLHIKRNNNEKSEADCKKKRKKMQHWDTSMHSTNTLILSYWNETGIRTQIGGLGQ